MVPALLVEWNPHACAAIRRNRRHPLACDWSLYDGDVRDYDFSKLAEPDLATGGAPCQPFSLGGKHKGYDDKRDMFPAAIAVVERLRPRAFLFENVKGLAR